MMVKDRLYNMNEIDALNESTFPRGARQQVVPAIQPAKSSKLTGITSLNFLDWTRLCFLDVLRCDLDSPYTRNFTINIVVV